MCNWRNKTTNSLLLLTSRRYLLCSLAMGWFLNMRRSRGCNADTGQGLSERYTVRIRSANVCLKTILANYGTGKKHAPLPCFELILHSLLKWMFDPWRSKQVCAWYSMWLADCGLWEQLPAGAYREGARRNRHDSSWWGDHAGPRRMPVHTLRLWEVKCHHGLVRSKEQTRENAFPGINNGFGVRATFVFKGQTVLKR